MADNAPAAQNPSFYFTFGDEKVPIGVLRHDVAAAGINMDNTANLNRADLVAEIITRMRAAPGGINTFRGNPSLAHWQQNGKPSQAAQTRQARLAAENARVERVEGRIADVITELEHMETENDHVRETLAIETRLRRDLEHKNTNLANELGRLRFEVEELSNQKLDAEDRANVAEAELVKARKEIGRIGGRIGEERRLRKEVQVRAEELVEENEGLRERVEELMRDESRRLLEMKHVRKQNEALRAALTK
ncbi:hypothetical protein BJ508DRAFT_329459 [Ascobolus immersus RN42]|uniref:Uncharacterized protein n=1 Tax=Ascobolus immersus RN42 TaxID=1160509 RepID=A0A3N4I258_ASCIM|nr:hypothetical protein BJ508DRAFT_329459 [Ascobolus immersus RN42]